MRDALELLPELEGDHFLLFLDTVPPVLAACFTALKGFRW